MGCCEMIGGMCFTIEQQHNGFKSLQSVFPDEVHASINILPVKGGLCNFD